MAAEQHPRWVSLALGSFALAVTVAWAVAACEGEAAKKVGVGFAGETMGTTYRVSVRQLPPNLDAARLETELANILDTVNAQMSTYLSDSALSRFNRLSSTEWIDVPLDVVTVVESALEVSRLSDGAFDVTVGPLVNLWGFGPQAREQGIPSAEDLEAVRPRVGHWYLQTRTSPPAVRKRRPDVYVDLSAIAKGFAVDRLAAHLDEQGVNDYLVEIGGDLRAKGVNAKGIPWQVGIERPVADSRVVQKVVGISGRAMATSGDYRNFFERDGQRFSHTLNPQTGRPVTHTLASVTVVARSATYADALATALLVLGPQAGYELAEQENLAALFIVEQGDRFVEKATDAFFAEFPNVPE